MNFTDLFSKNSDKTRIAVVSDNKNLLKIFQYIAERNEISLTAVNNESVDFNHYFAAAVSDDSNDIADFYPTIVLIAQNYTGEISEKLLKNITGGGILIHPSKTELPTVENYFRKLTYEFPEINNTDKSLEIVTEMGNIPVVLDEETAKEIFGLQLLSQQIGIMDDEFYDAVMNLEVAELS